MNRLNEITGVLPDRLKAVILERLEVNSTDIYISDVNRRFYVIYKKLQEIRLRVNKPFAVTYDGSEKMFNDVIVSVEEIRQCIQYISSYSVYAYRNDIKRGFITIQGGHRAGLAGQAVFDAEKMTDQKNISFINIRVAHEICGCADKLMDFIWKDGCLKHTLIISPPACGKTTMLRDIIRQLSYGDNRHCGIRIGVVDERSELAACYEGIPQNDLGPRTDVLDQAYKADGMLLLLRSMSPQLIAVDELGGPDDIRSVKYLMHCGCVVFATIHGYSLDEVIKRMELREIIGTCGFSRIITLCAVNGAGSVKETTEIR